MQKRASMTPDFVLVLKKYFKSYALCVLRNISAGIIDLQFKIMNEQTPQENSTLSTRIRHNKIMQSLYQTYTRNYKSWRTIRYWLHAAWIRWKDSQMNKLQIEFLNNFLIPSSSKKSCFEREYEQKKLLRLIINTNTHKMHTHSV